MSFSFFFQHSFAIYPYLLQLKYFGFLSLKLSFNFPMSMGCPHPPYVVFIPVLQLCCLSINLYSCSTKVITIFHFFNISNAAMGGYPNIILIMSGQIFFFNKKIMYNLLVSAFMANASNSIIKSTVFCFPCLKDSIFHLAFAVFILLLNIVLISFTKFS